MNEERMHRVFLKNFVGGIGWALGITLGFAVVTYGLGKFLESLGGLPFVGNIFADLINITQEALVKK